MGGREVSTSTGTLQRLKAPVIAASLGGDTLPRMNASGRLVSLVLSLLGCSRGGASTALHPESSVSAASEGGCAPSALRLDHARALRFVRAPTGCAPGSDSSPLWRPLRDEAAARAAFGCADSGAFSVDFTRETVWISSRSLSPAGAGFAAYDDGRAVHVVSKMRRPRPDDPRPMPMPFVIAIALPAGESREFIESACTL